MPKVTYTGVYELGDYFDKYGFGDGDDSVQRDAAVSNWGLAVKTVNKYLRKYKLPLVAEQLHAICIHNEVRIQIRRKTDMNTVYEVEVYGGPGSKLSVSIGNPGELPASIRKTFSEKVYPGANEEFERKAK